MKKKHFLIGTSLFCLFLFAFATVAGAADTRINTVSITIKDAGELESGCDVADVYTTTNNKEFTIDTAYFTTENSVWHSGETPQVCVELYANSGYRFSYTSKSHFELSGYGAKFKKAKIVDGGDGMELYIKLDEISGRPAQVENLYWKKNVARWDKMDEADYYEVRLYRGNSIVTTKKVSKNYYDFTSDMTKKGRYTFRVRSISKYDVTGSWSEYSDDRDVSSSEADKNQSSSGSNFPNNDWDFISPDDNFKPQSIGWLIDNGRWWYRNPDGSYTKNNWQFINNKWYYFDQNGYMCTGWLFINNRYYFTFPDGAMTTGWQFINNRWYYMDSSGAMTTGWQYLNNRWYYMDPSGAMTTGWQYINNRWYYMDSSGAMTTGWQCINNKWYFLDASGALATNTTTPDNHRVDANGVRVS